MIKIIHYFIRQKLFINLMVFLILLSGSYILINMNREAFPNVNFDMVVITTIYPGATPDEIEQLISIPIEKQLREVNGLDKVRAYNIENVSVVVVYIDPDAEGKDKIVDDVKDGVESVDNLPENAERPTIDEIVLDKTPVIDVALSLESTNDKDYRRLRDTAKALEDLFYELDGVAQVERFGYLDREYLIEVDPEAMQYYRVGLNTLINKVMMRNFDLPGGLLRIGDYEYLLRTKGQYEGVEGIEETVVLANVAGYTTKLKQLAKVSDTFAEAKVLERFNGENSIVLKVWKKQTADIIRLTDSLKKEIEPFKKNHPDIDTHLFNDYSRFVRSRLSSLIVNGIIGLVLLIISLILMLGLRMSAIVAFAIPLSFMIAFMGMHLSGITINVISMFALVMVLGMIVDFSIVVAENSYRHLEDGWDRIRAVEQGTAEVFWPVTTTLLCITAAFAPLLYMTGMVGKFVWGIPMVIIISLSAAWFGAMFILPNHLESMAAIKKRSTLEHGKSRTDSFYVIQQKYRKMLQGFIGHRYLVLVGLTIVFLASLVISALFLGFVFFPGGGGEGLIIRSKMAQGTNLQTNLRTMKKIEEPILRLPKHELESLHSKIGIELSGALDPAPSEGTHRATFMVHLTPVNDRDREAEQILEQLRDEISKTMEREHISDKVKLDFRVEQGGPPVGLPINIEIRGSEFETLKKMADMYIDYLNSIDGVFDVSLDLEDGKEEFRFAVREEIAAQAGVSVLDIAQAIRTAFDGSTATKLNIGDDEVDIKVRFPEAARQKLSSLGDVYIANNQGGLVPLSKVTEYVRQPGYAMINRLNFKRVVQVKGNVNVDKITSLEVNTMLANEFKNIERDFPGYAVNYGGEEEDRQKSMANLAILFLFALLIIFIILASFFRSLLLPVVVMSVIPFGLVGVIFALLSHGKPLSFMSLLGVVSLAGVIVSNTLVLVQFINNLRRSGLNLMDALVEGGAIRLRPVILTSATTVLGLIPTVYGIGGEDAFVAPLALAFGYGLIFATFITLVMIPVFYHIAEDFKVLIARIAAKMHIQVRATLLADDE